MQYRALVLIPADTANVVEAVTRLMEPYDIGRTVPPHKELVSQDEIDYLIDVFDLGADDPEAVMAELREESGFECFIEDGKIYWMTTDNPQGHWDGWVLRSLTDDVWAVSAIPDDRVPSAIVTPDGAWHDLSYKRDATEDKDVMLRKRAGLVLERYPTYLAVSLDCHR